MKTLADVKRRAQMGVKMKMTYHAFGAPKIVGLVRSVVVVRAHEIGLLMSDGKASYLPWPKAKNLRVTGPDTFDIVFGDEAHGIHKPEDAYMSYEFVEG